MALVKCKGKGGRCNNHTKSPDGLCYAHSHAARRGANRVTAATVAMQSPVRGIGMPARVKYENEHPVPQNTAGIPGAPYFTTHDMDFYQRCYLNGEGFSNRFPNSDILERWPLKVVEASGARGADYAVAVVTSAGTIHTFTPAASGRDPNPTADEIGDGQRWSARMYYMEMEKNPILIKADETYLFVFIDHEAITERLAG